MVEPRSTEKKQEIHEIARKLITDLYLDLRLSDSAEEPKGKLSEMAREVSASVLDNSRFYHGIAKSQSWAMRIADIAIEKGSKTIVPGFGAALVLMGASAILANQSADVESLLKYVATVPGTAGITGLTAAGLGKAGKGAAKIVADHFTVRTKLDWSQKRIINGANHGAKELSQRLSLEERDILERIEDIANAIQLKAPELGASGVHAAFKSALKSIESSKALTSNASQITGFLRGVEKQLTIALDELMLKTLSANENLAKNPKSSRTAEINASPVVQPG